MPYQRPQIEDVPENPIVPHNARPAEVYELEDEAPVSAARNEEALDELFAWSPSPRNPAARRVNELMQDVVRLRDENLHLQQSREEEVQRHRRQNLILQQQIEALEDSRNEYHRRVWEANVMLDNLLHSHHLLEADLEDVRRMEARAQEDLRRVQRQSARLQLENSRLRIERDRARDSLVGVLQPFGGRPMFSPRN